MIGLREARSPELVLGTGLNVNVDTDESAACAIANCNARRSVDVQLEIELGIGSTTSFAGTSFERTRASRHTHRPSSRTCTSIGYGAACICMGAWRCIAADMIMSIMIVGRAKLKGMHESRSPVHCEW